MGTAYPKDRIVVYNHPSGGYDLTASRDPRNTNPGRSSVSILVGIAVLVFGAPLWGQEEGPLRQAVRAAQDSWMAHDVDLLVASSDTVRLHIPGIAPSASLRPGQASRLLDRYLKPTEEVSFELLNVRALAEDHAYAEIHRRYVVKGTTEEREETVFLGFRRIDMVWSLREVRVTP